MRNIKTKLLNGNKTIMTIKLLKPILIFSIISFALLIYPNDVFAADFKRSTNAATCSKNYMKASFVIEDKAAANGIVFTGKNNNYKKIYYCVKANDTLPGYGTAYPSQKLIEEVKNDAKKRISMPNKKYTFFTFRNLECEGKHNCKGMNYTATFNENENVKKENCNKNSCVLKDSSNKCPSGYAYVYFKAFLDYSDKTNEEIKSYYGTFSDGKQDKAYCVKAGQKIPNPGKVTIEGRTFDGWTCSESNNPAKKIVVGETTVNKATIHCNLNYTEVKENVEKPEEVNFWDTLFNKNASYEKCGLGGKIGLSDRLLALLVKIYKTITTLAVVVVIVLGMLDFLKATSSDDADAMKKAGQKFMKRFIAVVLLVILPYIIEFVLGTFGNEQMKTCVSQFR